VTGYSANGSPSLIVKRFHVSGPGNDGLAADDLMVVRLADVVMAFTSVNNQAPFTN
jgi:hypothetical protein